VIVVGDVDVGRGQKAMVVIVRDQSV